MNDLAASSNYRQGTEVSVSVPPVTLLRLLGVLIAVFGLLHLVAMPIYVNGASASEGIYVKVGRFFMLMNENSVTTWFTVILIALNAFLLTVNATAARQLRTGSALPWLFLAAIIAYLSMDEMLELHERIGVAVAHSLKFSDKMAFPWVVTGLAFTTVVGLSFIGFLRRLPRRTARLFILAGGVYVGGALGLEVIELLTVSKFGMGAIFYIEVMFEECMEMFGQALFAYALLDHLAQQRATIRLWES